jgi:hypothetical protein
MAKDVMEVLRGMIERAERDRLPMDVSALKQVNDAFSELIAADVEYNEAKATLFGWNTSFGSRYRRYLVAEERRAAALAACRGLA